MLPSLDLAIFEEVSSRSVCPWTYQARIEWTRFVVSQLHCMCEFAVLVGVYFLKGASSIVKDLIAERPTSGPVAGHSMALP